MNSIGIHAIVWVAGVSEPECLTAIEKTRAAGYDLLEIPLLDLSVINTLETRKALNTAGLGVICSLGLSMDTDISSADSHIVARGEEFLNNAIVIVHNLGANYLGGIISSALGKYSQQPSAAGRANCVAVLRRVAEHAAAQGITLGVEVVNRYESNLVNTAEQALRLIDDVGADNVTVHLDTYHMNIEELDFTSPVAACGERLGYVHIGENHRGYLGSGTVNFHAFFDALAEINYQGAVTFESFSSAVAAPGLSATLAIWRTIWTDNMDLATHAYRFIDAQLRRTADSSH